MDTNEAQRIELAYLREGPRILAWLGRRLGPEAAEDALQDTLTRALANLDALEPVRDLASWLWRSARNAVIDAWRARIRRPALEDGADLDRMLDRAMLAVHDAYERDELLDALAAAIEDLSPEQREVVEAQALGGESFASIAERTGTPIDTLASRKRYALARLRKALEFYLPEDTHG